MEQVMGKPGEGWPLIVLMLGEPWIGVRVRWPNVLHAVTMEGLPVKTWPDGKATSACGLSGLRLVAHQDGGPVAWPPRVRSLRADMVRCYDCYVATGKPRPKSTFQPSAA